MKNNLTLVQTSNIADNAVTSAKIADNAVTSDQLASGSVGNSELENSSVTSVKLAANSVVESRIASSAVQESKINSNAVTSSKIKNGAVTSAKIADNAVSASKLDADSVETASIKNNAVTLAKMATGTSGKFLKFNASGVLEEVDAPSSGGGGSTTFTALTDTPASIVAGAILQGNASGDAVEFAAADASFSSSASANGLSSKNSSGISTTTPNLTGANQYQFFGTSFDNASGLWLSVTDATPVDVCSTRSQRCRPWTVRHGITFKSNLSIPQARRTTQSGISTTKASQARPSAAM